MYYNVLECKTMLYIHNKGEACASPNILLRLFCHEAIVIFIPLGFVFVFEFWDEGILAYLALWFLFQYTIDIGEDFGECLGDNGFIDAEVDHALCELELCL